MPLLSIHIYIYYPNASFSKHSTKFSNASTRGEVEMSFRVVFKISIKNFSQIALFQVILLSIVRCFGDGCFDAFALFRHDEMITRTGRESCA